MRLHMYLTDCDVIRRDQNRHDMLAAMVVAMFILLLSQAMWSPKAIEKAPATPAQTEVESSQQSDGSDST